MSGRRSLRVSVTVVATVVIALPLLGIAAVAAVFLRDQAMRFETAPTKLAVICLSGALSTDMTGTPTRRTSGKVSLGEECAGGEHEVEITSRRIGDYAISGLADADRVVFLEARYNSVAHIPQLSLWPFTDPRAIDAFWIGDTGEGGPDQPSLRFPGPVLDEVVAAQTTLNHRVLGLFGGAVALTALFAFVVWFATGRVLRPVQAIRRELADITGHDLARRVPVPGTRNEIARLAVTVNATLDRLQAAVEENRRFVADASHELRSPIAALRAELEIAHAHPDLTDWRAVVDGALRDTYRLQQLAGDLLLLARLDHAPAAASDDVVDLVELVRTETARRGDRVPALDLGDRPVRVRGSRPLLARLLANLLDNAERHAADRVTVRLTEADGVAWLHVVDDGPGIPPEDRERVFERFTRLDDARTRETGGTGLGLPIARRIARLHRGALDVADAPDHGGACLTATLPVVSG
ncbi:HAMP domain-containing histidine kinase [Saccharothrix sp. S26]|uniref:sensor histidine kinase n=1 Tax=Saccharothrix sp. S26 TaxID=2907215 RepID=UPI001F3681F3|nr:HAMP domain-containing sensor histidine kinase [Saccharothrix sp. S26]MCE6996552.1 HAMP domain-containing histidine kinase [Saccharothrix sp. S26]